VEITREVTKLKGKRCGRHSVKTALLVSCLAMTQDRAMELLLIIRRYWRIEAGQ